MDFNKTRDIYKERERGKSVVFEGKEAERGIPRERARKKERKRKIERERKRNDLGFNKRERATFMIKPNDVCTPKIIRLSFKSQVSDSDPLKFYYMMRVNVSVWRERGIIVRIVFRERLFFFCGWIFSISTNCVCQTCISYTRIHHLT